MIQSACNTSSYDERIHVIPHATIKLNVSSYRLTGRPAPQGSTPLPPETTRTNADMSVPTYGVMRAMGFA